MEAALQVGGFRRFVLLQGLDYPIMSAAEIDRFFETHRQTEYISAVSETQSRSNTDRHKYVLRYNLDSSRRSARLRTKVNAAIMHYLPFRLPRPHIRISGRRCDIYRGWAQVALTDRAVEYIVDFHRKNPRYNDFFRKVYAADESYFHTIIYNSQFASRTVAGHSLAQELRSVNGLLNLTYFEYPDVVRVFENIEDYRTLRATGFLYFRKVTSRSKALLDHIDECHSQAH